MESSLLFLRPFFEAGLLSHGAPPPLSQVKAAKMKACPHCGSHNLDVSQPLARVGILEWAVECLSCGDPGPLRETESEAVEAYNQRAPNPRKQLKQLQR